MSLSKMNVLGAFNKLSKIHNDVARLVFAHDLTNSENTKKVPFCQVLRMLIIVNFLGFYAYRAWPLNLGYNGF